jgi:hypothetical protein
MQKELLNQLVDAVTASGKKLKDIDKGAIFAFLNKEGAPKNTWDSIYEKLENIFNGGSSGFTGKKEDKWDLNTVFLLEELFHEVYKMSFYDYFVLSALEHKLKIEIAMKDDEDILFVLAKDKKKSAKKKASKKKK